jgi:Domain of unknown function (DUF1772)
MTSIPAARAVPRLPAIMLDLAQLGHAHWLFGNLYEAVVKIPERLSTDAANSAGIIGRPASLLAPGSPVRYYVPVAPLTLATTLAALITGWKTVPARRWLATAATSSVFGAATTGYLIRNVNLRLFFAAQPPPPAERDALIRSWYRINILRTAAAGVALFAAYRARQASISACTERITPRS